MVWNLQIFVAKQIKTVRIPQLSIGSLNKENDSVQRIAHTKNLLHCKMLHCVVRHYLCIEEVEYYFILILFYIDLQYPSYLFGIENSALREKLIRWIFVPLVIHFLPTFQYF